MATKYLDLTGLQTLISKLYAREFNGMGLSANDFTNALKTKLEGLAAPADITALQGKVAALESLIEVDKDGAINKFNEIVAFLEGITETSTLEGVLGDISTQIANVKKTADAAQPKVSGKGLSTNDYTTAEKNKVTNCPANTTTAIATAKTEAINAAKADIDVVSDALDNYKTTVSSTYVAKSEIVAITTAEITAALAV